MKILENLEDGYSLIEYQGENKILTPKNEVISCERYNDILSFIRANKIDWVEDENSTLWTDIKSSTAEKFILNGSVKQFNNVNTYTQKVLTVDVANKEFLMFNLTQENDAEVQSSFCKISLAQVIREIKNDYNKELSNDDVATIHSAVEEILFDSGLDKEHPSNTFEQWVSYKVIIEGELTKVVYNSESGQISSIKSMGTITEKEEKKADNVKKVLL